MPLNSYVDESNRRKIEHWITSEDQGAEHRDVAAKRQDGTGDWFLMNVDAWIHGSGVRSWCLGLAGTGKTILASSLINFLRQGDASDRPKVLHYYFNYKKKENQKADRFCASLLKQLSMQSRALLPYLEFAYARSTPPAMDEMFVRFAQEISNAGRVFIVVDALDECFSDDGSVANVLELLRRLPSNVNWLVTARNTPEIRQMAESEGEFYDIKSDEGDMTRFLSKNILSEQSLRTMVEHTSGLEDEIKRSIIENSNNK